jgi:Cu/Zn superoxide dismutase
VEFSGSLNGFAQGDHHAVHILNYYTDIDNSSNHFSLDSAAPHNCNPKLGHTGDLGNFIADSSGVLHINLKSQGLRISQMLGKIIVITATENS